MVNSKYTLCVAGYYKPGEDVNQIVRVTAVVTDIQKGKDEIVEKLEFWLDNGNWMNNISDAILVLAKKYDTNVHQLSELVPLEVCSCGCKEYTDRCITSEDLIQSCRDYN